MMSPLSALREQLKLSKKLYPQFVGLISNWEEDLEDTQVLTGNPAQRVFRAIREGYTLQSEICKRADVAGDLLDEMVACGVLTTIDQGGKTEGARGARKKIFQIVPARKTKPAPRSDVRQLAHA